MLRPRLLVVALLCLVQGIVAQHGTSAPRPQDGPATIALFVVRPGAGEAPLAVRFVDRSFGDITSWVWEFGDGQTSNLQNPTHVYTEGGVYDVHLTVTGPYGTARLGKPGGVTVRSCTLENARLNRAGPLRRGEDFVPITGDDALGFYCVYSGKAIAADNPRIDNNVGMFIFPLANGEVLLFGAGYGDPNSFVEPTVDAAHDVRRVDAIIRFCMGRVPENTPIRFVTPHGHIDHINADCIRELRRRGYPIVDITFHSRDATWAKGMPGWTAADRTAFRTLRSATGACQEELLSFASPLGKIWFFLREGHTPGSIDLVIDVRNDPSNRLIVRGSGEVYGSCPIPGVRESIEPHGNVRLQAPEPRLLALDPATGTSFGGNEVVLMGGGFAAELAGPPLVLFDGSPASSVSVLADDTLTCVTPPGLPGETVSIRVINRNGQVVLDDGYAYRRLPTLTGATPARGLASGGTRVTLSGSGFEITTPGPSVVTFGGVPAKAVQVLDDATLQCTIPPHAPGLVGVALSNENGAAQLGTPFLYDPVIDVLSVSPANGSALGGTRVQINGSAFATGSALPEVFFGSARATAVARTSDTRLECTTPTGPSGAAVDVRVSAVNGTDTLVGGFRYFAAPKVTALDPASGSGAGGTLVTLTGSNFTKNSAGSNRVTFGGLVASGVVTVSDTSIRCLAPAGASGSSVDVLVSNANGTGRLDQGYRYNRPPFLVALEPEQGSRAGGTPVTLRGAHFQESGAGATTVLFAGVPGLDVIVLDDFTLSCRTPGAQSDASVDVEVVNANGRARLVQAFQYVTRPVLLGLDPSSGPARGGASVTLHGAGFLAPGAGATVVRFGSEVVADARVVDDSTLVCSTPLGLPAARVDVQVSNQNGSARLQSAYHYLALPSISALAPDEGKLLGGTRVRLSGAGFLAGGVPSVRFGLGEALDVVVPDDRTLLCTTPPGAQGAVDVGLRTVAGTVILRAGFVYGSTRPTLSGLEPGHGPSLGGTSVELQGSNFLASQAGTSTVEFGGVAAPLVMTLNDTRIRCIAPPGVPGALVDVRVRNANGSVTQAAAYRYHLQPALASVGPQQGSSLGGFLVSVRGAGFVRDEALDLMLHFGAAPASELQVLDDTTLTCRAPAGSPAAVVDIQLSNSNGGALLPGAFRYLGAPLLESVAPISGTPLGGTTVTLTGADFDAAGTGGAGSTLVRFGTAPATQVTILNETTLTCLAPAGAPGVSSDVRIENPNGAATLVRAYRYHGAPVLAALAPGNGPSAGGTTVFLTGSGFTSNVVGPNTVSFGGQPARNVITVDDTRVRALAPAGTAGTSVDLVLSNSNGSAGIFQGFRYNAAPTLSAFEPPGASAIGGVAVTLRGSGFQRDGAGANSVSFGAAPAGAVSVLDDQTLMCVTPAALAGTEVNVSLSNKNGTARAPDSFRYHPAPHIEVLAPPYGFSGGGTWIEIRGSGWLANGAGLNTITFGTNAPTEVLVVDDAVLRCRAPAGTPGPVVVRVDNTNGSSESLDGFYYDWAPTLTDVLPGQGTALGGTEVLLTGGGFATAGAGPLSVRFGATPATNVRIQDGQRLLCNAPPGPAGTTVSVVLSNSHGSSSKDFRYHPRPTLTSVDPSVGAPAGGTVVTLRGSGFSASGAGIPVVRFDATNATDLTVLDDTTVRCTAPSGMARAWPVLTLANTNGTATLTDRFRWLTRDPCDLNDDGVGDALLAGIDAAYLFFGADFGLGDESTASADLALRTASTGSDFGTQLASGDLNGDQLADLVVAAPLDDVGGADSGAVFVFFGPLSASPTARTEGSANATFRGAAAGDRFGASVVVRDVTGDGTGDLLVGAPFDDSASSDGGAVYVFPGRASFSSLTPAQAAVRLLAAGSQHSFGAALAAGDVTGDDRADVVVGAPRVGAGGGSSGAAYVFRGGPSLVHATASSALVTITGASSGDRLGHSVAVADFDGDGAEDLFVGAPDARNGSVQGGTLYYFRGGAGLVSGTAGSASAALEGENSGDRLGQVLGLGDVDGDGRADLLASGPQHDVPAANAGRAYLVLGGALQDGSIALRAHTILVAESSAGDQFGTGLALTDLDGDGRVDLVVGAPFSNGGGLDSGRVHVFWGAGLQAVRSGSADDLTYTGANASLALGRELGSSR